MSVEIDNMLSDFFHQELLDSFIKNADGLSPGLMRTSLHYLTL